MTRKAALHIVASWTVARVLVAVSYGLASWWNEVRAERPTSSPTLDQGLLAWDGSWYQWIAQLGYADAPEGALRFFPLYPLLGRWLAPVLDGREGLALVVIANLAALVAAGLLFLLVRSVRGEVTGIRAVWILALYPASFVLVFAYSEPLFLVFALVALLALRTDRYELAALAGFAATLTRSLGVLLAIVVVVEALQSRRLSASDLRRRALAALGPVAGLALHLRWSAVTFDSWRAPIDAQRETRGDFVDPVSRLVDTLSDGFGGDQTSLLHGLAFLGFVALLWTARKALPLSYLAWAAAGLLIGMSAETINSFERYALSLVPLVIAGATVPMSRRTQFGAAIASAGGFVVLTSAAFYGTYVP